MGSPTVLGWLSPFSLALIANPFGTVAFAPLAILLAAGAFAVAVALVFEHGREFGAAALRAQGGSVSAPTLHTPARITLRLQYGTLAAMLLAGLGVGAFAATLAGLALSDEGRNEAIGENIRNLIGKEGPLYELLLSYVMVLVGECAAIAGALSSSARERRKSPVTSS